MQLHWLPPLGDKKLWQRELEALTGASAIRLANMRLNFVQTNQLDQEFAKTIGNLPADQRIANPVRLAILASCTTTHLDSAIRVGCLRRKIDVEIYEPDYGQYWRELNDPASGLHQFSPTAILFSLDAHHLAAGATAGLSGTDADAAFCAIQEQVRNCWRMARELFQCPIIHQASLPVHVSVIGQNEHRLHGSKAAFIARWNTALRAMADEEGVDILAVDEQAARDGLANWHDPALWHRAKQEISPLAAPIYGDLLGRLLAAKLGRSSKCLVMDLDNTLWGGVIGDDGLEGIILGQGSASGEAFCAFQEYARELSRRGIILAVCSKNDEANAIEPFRKHPEMVLREADISCFVANWSDKAANIRAIATELNIGLDSLVFVDDNPFERNLVRQELPMVAIPEIGDDPATFARTLADAGYFETLHITQDDRQRTSQYQGNRMRDALSGSATDIPSYLRSLDMVLEWRKFDRLGLARIAQLINKTNQFNLTTRRYTEEDILSFMQDEACFGLQLRLADRFGDNGIISIVIGKRLSDEDLLIDTWLMSCRVLGRHVEQSTLDLVVEQARRIGARRLIGEYIPSKKNGMVETHYEKLGFTRLTHQAEGAERFVLNLENFKSFETFITVKEG